MFLQKNRELFSQTCPKLGTLQPTISHRVRRRAENSIKRKNQCWKQLFSRALCLSLPIISSELVFIKSCQCWCKLVEFDLRLEKSGLIYMVTKKWRNIYIFRAVMSYRVSGKLRLNIVAGADIIMTYILSP